MTDDDAVGAGAAVAADTSGLTQVLDDLEHAVALGEQLGLDDELDQVREVLTHASRRRRLAPETTVVALLGATGSGKSSLANVLAGGQVTRVSRTRPTTTHPLAIVPDTAAEAATLLDWLAINRRVSVSGSWSLGQTTVLVDLPDIDSDEPVHRAVAERMAGKVDVLVWVLDPEKYADGVVHRDFLTPMAAHADVTVIALNQIDRLDAEGREAVVTDLRRLLEREGLANAPVVPVSAHTGEGLETLARAVASVATDRLAGARSLAAHVRRVAGELASRTGLNTSAGHGGAAATANTQQPLIALRRAAAAVAGIDVVTQAVEGADRHRAQARVGWFWLRWVEYLRRDPLRALRLGAGRRGSPGSTDADDAGQEGARRIVDLSSLPPAGPAAMGNLRISAHTYAVAACAGLPDDLAVQAVGRSDERAENLAVPLDRAVAAVDYGAWRRPAWWAVANVLQWVTALTALAGGLWLVAIHLLEDYLLLISIDAPRWGRVPWPTVLLLGGLLTGLVLAVLGTLLARVQARRHRRRISHRLRRATDEVIDTELIEHLRTETHRWAELAQALGRIT